MDVCWLAGLWTLALNGRRQTPLITSHACRLGNLMPPFCAAGNQFRYLVGTIVAPSGSTLKSGRRHPISKRRSLTFVYSHVLGCWIGRCCTMGGCLQALGYTLAPWRPESILLCAHHASCLARPLSSALVLIMMSVLCVSCWV